jgi:ribosomal protein S15P/S13E
MKVFEVISEYCPGDSKEVITERQYVTSEEDTLLSVTKYFTRHCEEYERDLKSVREVLIIVQHISESSDDYYK